jgi:uncharacterized membrane protein
MPGTAGKIQAHGGVSARRRVITCATLGAAAGLLSAVFLPWDMAPLVGWDVAALVYVCWIWLALWWLDGEETAAHAETEDPTRAAAEVLLLSAAVVSLAAIGLVLVRAGNHRPVGLIAAFAAVSVVISWLSIHTTYALRYAALYYAGPDGGADFHQPGKPQYSDFAYLAFTVGMTFQVSDTEMNSTEFRASVLRHALLSYLFGAVILALAINLVAGLSK